MINDRAVVDAEVLLSRMTRQQWHLHATVADTQNVIAPRSFVGQFEALVFVP